MTSDCSKMISKVSSRDFSWKWSISDIMALSSTCRKMGLVPKEIHADMVAALGDGVSALSIVNLRIIKMIQGFDFLQPEKNCVHLMVSARCVPHHLTPDIKRTGWSQENLILFESTDFLEPFPKTSWVLSSLLWSGNKATIHTVDTFLMTFLKAGQGRFIFRENDGLICLRCKSHCICTSKEPRHQWKILWQNAEVFSEGYHEQNSTKTDGRGLV